MEPRRLELDCAGGQSSGALPLSCFKKFVNTLDTRFSEMIGLHRQIVLNLLDKQEERQNEIDSMLKQRIEYDQDNTIIQFKNQELREFLSQRSRHWPKRNAKQVICC